MAYSRPVSAETLRQRALAKWRKELDAAHLKGHWFKVGYFAQKLDPHAACTFTEPARREQWELGARSARAEVNRQ